MAVRIPWWVRLEWRMPRVLLALCVLEFPLTVACLALYGIADPDTYRTALWQEGANNGWNSDPSIILYAISNYRPIPVPTPWAQFITDYNVVIVVLSMFILLAKCVMYITDVLPPIASAVLHALLISLYAYSISQQAGSDMSDPTRPSKIPWYITRSCGPPVSPANQGYCMQAKASFGVAVALCGLFTIYMLFSIFNAIPTRAQRDQNDPKLADVETPVTSAYGEKSWGMEMNQLPRTPAQPLKSPLKSCMTPRTLAFNTLDGAVGARRPNSHLPLRHHIAMGEDTYQSPTR
jgi:hypothetical protein